MDKPGGRKFDKDKPRWDLLDLALVEEEVKVLTYGAKKYEANNWKKVKDAPRRYLAAALRHLVSYQKGETLDPESGLSHLAHASCNLRFLQYFERKT